MSPIRDLNKFRYNPSDNSSQPKLAPNGHRPYPVKQDESTLNTIPPILTENLIVVFVGFNPGTESGKTGHHYAHRSNRFWKFLNLSGLTNELVDASQDIELPQRYGYGFTDLVARSTKGITALTRQERLQGAGLLERRITTYSPVFIAFVGKGIWDTVCAYKGWSSKQFQYGPQQDHKFGGATPVVLPSSSGLVSIAKEDQLVWWRQLERLVSQERDDRITDRAQKG